MLYNGGMCESKLQKPFVFPLLDMAYYDFVFSGANPTPPSSSSRVNYISNFCHS